MITGSEIVSVPALQLVYGILTVIICTLGIIGVCLLWRDMLILVRLYIFVLFRANLSSTLLVWLCKILSYIYFKYYNGKRYRVGYGTVKPHLAVTLVKRSPTI